jgi:hypothetical protein
LVSQLITDAHDMRPAAPLTLTADQFSDQTAPEIGSGEERASRVTTR